MYINMRLLDSNAYAAVLQPIMLDRLIDSR